MNRDEMAAVVVSSAEEQLPLTMKCRASVEDASEQSLDLRVKIQVTDERGRNAHSQSLLPYALLLGDKYGVLSAAGRDMAQDVLRLLSGGSKQAAPAEPTYDLDFREVAYRVTRACELLDLLKQLDRLEDETCDVLTGARSVLDGEFDSTMEELRR